MKTLLALSIIVLGTTVIPMAFASDQVAVSVDGIGSVKLGMTLKDAEKALSARFGTFAESGYDSEACWQTSTAEGQGPPVSYMVQNGIITRIDISEYGEQKGSAPRTSEGLGVGSTEQQVMAVYGKRVTQSPHPYIGSDGKYLEILTSDGKRGLLFETDNGTVTSYRSGQLPSLRYWEGCL